MNYFHDGRTCYVKVGVTVNDIEVIDMLPVMDFRNKSIPVDSVTSFDVNKAIQRSTVKCIAMHGLGIALYTHEDIPEPAEVDAAPVELKIMSPRSASWDAVEKFIITSRHEDFDTLVQRMSTKYKFTGPSIKKLQAVYDTANDEPQQEAPES